MVDKTQMKTDLPRVSIGMPIYNGEPFLAESIESILSQSFENFELIISDNASTDRTQAICTTFAEKDNRLVDSPDFASIRRLVADEPIEPNMQMNSQLTKK